jgi:copper chaperone CopZ
VFKVSGMTCAACAERLSRALRGVPGVRGAEVTLDPPAVRVSVEPGVTSEQLGAAAAQAGYSLGAVEGGEGGVPELRGAEARPASLYPLALIVGYIAGTVLLVAWVRGRFEWHALMLDFMGGFFLVFSFFKLLDLRGFADAYQTYDVLAGRVRAWALVYPFVELGLGVAYLARWNLPAVNASALVLMLLGSAGVLRALMRREALRCACLGTALKLPMTTVTLVEDLGMAAMAGVMLVFR